MPKLNFPHHGSLQFWPRKRAEKRLPSANWKTMNVTSKTQSVLGFIGYKVGMGSAVAKDNTEHSMTKGKKIVIPVTIVELPNMKVFSVRFYKNGIVQKDVVVSNDKELKRVVRVPKELKPLDSVAPKDFDDIRVVAFSMPKQTAVKKAPDVIELAVNASNKLEYVKSLIGKEITARDFLHFDLLDVRGLTIGKGLVGPVKRFGINLKQHKTEKGVRRPGSLGPWHPARVTFVTPMAGQLGNFTRCHYNFKVVTHNSITEKDVNPKEGFKHYGKIRSNYVVLRGSVQGPAKSQVLLTPSYRPTKDAAKKKFEFQELIV